MDGITILNQFAETVTKSNTKLALIISLSILSAFIVWGVLDWFFGKNQLMWLIIFMGIVTAGIVFVITCGITEHEAPTGKTIYQVTISDSVNFKEFTDTYEILDQDGLIYTIVEK